MSVKWGLLIIGAVIPWWFVALYVAIHDIRRARRPSGGKEGKR